MTIVWLFDSWKAKHLCLPYDEKKQPLKAPALQGLLYD